MHAVFRGQDAYRGSPAAAVIRRSCFLVLVFPLAGDNGLDPARRKLNSVRKLSGVLRPIPIGDSGIADLLMPAGDRQLGSEDGGTSLVAILADLPNFAALVFIQRRHGPVINDQNIDAA